MARNQPQGSASLYFLFSKTPPLLAKRYGHTMSYNDKLGVLVVFGGRNDITFLHDIHIFRLDNQNWQNVHCHNDPEVGRAFHASAHIGYFILI